MPSLSRTEIFSTLSRYQLSVTLELSAGKAQITLPETGGNLEIDEEYELSALTSVTESATRPGGCDLKYQLRINGTLYYWSGAAWVVSDGTIAQANTTAEINTNKASLPISGTGSRLKIRAVLSGTGLATPSLDSFTTVYAYDAVEAGTYSICRVHVELKDLLGAAFPNATGKFWCKSEGPIAHGDGLIVPDTTEAAFTNGFAELLIPETETPNKQVRFFVSLDEGGSTRVLPFEPCVVPNRGSANLLSITIPVGELQ